MSFFKKKRIYIYFLKKNIIKKNNYNTYNMTRKKQSKPKALAPVPDQDKTQFKVESVVQKKVISKPKEIFVTFDGLPEAGEKEYKARDEYNKRKKARGKTSK